MKALVPINPFLSRRIPIRKTLRNTPFCQFWERDWADWYSTAVMMPYSRQELLKK
jgi:hypothetical protein